MDQKTGRFDQSSEAMFDIDSVTFVVCYLQFRVSLCCEQLNRRLKTIIYE
jgi:hypothetical protein